MALLLQSVGIALPALFGGPVAAVLISAALFGATFLGVASIMLAIGADLRARAVAILTTGYSLGQIVGPLAVGPLLHHGYHQALLVSAGVVALAATAAALVRHQPNLGELS